jgi:predicted aconitase
MKVRRMLAVSAALAAIFGAGAATGGSVALADNGVIHVEGVTPNDNGVIHMEGITPDENGVIHMQNITPDDNGVIHLDGINHG